MILPVWITTYEFDTEYPEQLDFERVLYDDSFFRIRLCTCPGFRGTLTAAREFLFGLLLSFKGWHFGQVTEGDLSPLENGIQVYRSESSLFILYVRLGPVMFRIRVRSREVVERTGMSRVLPVRFRIRSPYRWVCSREWNRVGPRLRVKPEMEGQ